MGYETDLKLFIDGVWKTGEGRDCHDVVNPVDAQPIAALPYATKADLEEALAASDRAWPEWRAMDVEKRGAILHKTADLLRERVDLIAAHHDAGTGQAAHRIQARRRSPRPSCSTGMRRKPSATTAARWSARPARSAASSASRSVRSRPSRRGTSRSICWPRKSAPRSPPAARSSRARRTELRASATELFRALADAGIPAGVAQLVHGDSALVSETLIASRVIRKISFTGSTNVGKHLMRLCADSMTRLTMELGGHAPVLIFDDCDLEKTLDMVVPQKFRNAGQVCVSPTRFYVQSGIYDAFIKGFAERTQKVKIGNGLEEGVKMGPLANKRRPDAIDALVQDAKAKGARVMAGGERGDGGFFFQPTLARRRPQHRRHHERGAVRPGRGEPSVRHVRGSDR